MKKTLFPQEIIENTREANFSRHSVRSRTIYTIIVLAVISAFISLPFIHVDVGVRSQGLIRPVAEMIPLVIPVSGSVVLLNAFENSYIQRNDVVAIIDVPEIRERYRHNQSRKEQIRSFLGDIDLLTEKEDMNDIAPLELNTARYKAAFVEVSQALSSHRQRMGHARNTLDRDEYLFERNAQSRVMLEEARFIWHESVNQHDLVIRQFRNQLTLERLAYEEEYAQLLSEAIRLRYELSRKEIRAPVSGTIHQLNGLVANSFVHASQTLGVLSPDTTLIAEIYVAPRDIGFLHQGMAVKIQMDAFPHTDWGFVTGNIISIAEDVTLEYGTPLYRVVCSIDQDYLRLKNGFVGTLNKGMTFQARFIVQRRSLYQLLFDKVDDWLNPEWSQSSHLISAGGVQP